MKVRAITAAAGYVAGVAGLVWSFVLAQTAAPADTRPFVVFWVAFFAALVPLVRLAWTWGAPLTVRVAAVTAAAVYTTLPKLLRTASGPLFSDEFGHLYQTRRVLADGLFPGGGNPLLKVAPDFPLLHWLTAGLHHLGLPLWTAATVVASVAHIATVLGVFVLVREVTRSDRAGAAGAFFYTLQPGWLFFSAQFAYETLALPLLVWALWAALAARRHPGRARTVLLATVVALSAATALAHHMASAVLAVLLVGCLLGGFGRNAWDHRSTRVDAAVTAVAVAVIGAWLTSRALHLWDYYAPTIRSGIDRFSDPLASGGSRRAFAGSRVPTFERYAGFGFPFAVLVLAVGAVAMQWRRFVGRHVLMVFTTLAATFFVSLPLVLTTAGSEAAHRWWGYAYVGLAVVIGLGADIGARRFAWDFAACRPRGVRVALVVSALVAVAAVGGAASGTTVGYRFPGPPEVGNDARSITPEARAVAEWMRLEFGPGLETGVKVVADRYTAQQLVGYGEQITARPSPGYPAWDLYFSTDPTQLRRVGRNMRDDNARFVVVDTRMVTDRPVLGYWFNRTEPLAFTDTLVDPAALAKLDCAPWSELMAEVGHLRVYLIDTDLLAATGTVCS